MYVYTPIDVERSGNPEVRSVSSVIEIGESNVDGLNSIELEIGSCWKKNLERGEREGVMQLPAAGGFSFFFCFFLIDENVDAADLKGR